jgi:hypothetical protein
VLAPERRPDGLALELLAPEDECLAARLIRIDCSRGRELRRPQLPRLCERYEVHEDRERIRDEQAHKAPPALNERAPRVLEHRPGAALAAQRGPDLDEPLEEEHSDVATYDELARRRPPAHLTRM